MYAFRPRAQSFLRRDAEVDVEPGEVARRAAAEHRPASLVDLWSRPRSRRRRRADGRLRHRRRDDRHVGHGRLELPGRRLPRGVEGDREARGKRDDGGDDDEEAAAHAAGSATGADDPVCLSHRAPPDRPYNRRSGGRELPSRRGAAPRARAASPGRRVRGSMRERLAPAVLVAALLVATSAAFVVTEKLKLTRSPIVGPTVAKVFSPTCDCDTSSAEIRFRLRKADRVSVEIVDSSGHVVRELARDRPQGRRFVTYVWDGRDASGRVVDEGTYRPRVHLARPAPHDRDAEPDPRRHDAAAHRRASRRALWSCRPTATVASTAPRSATAWTSARRSSSTSTGCARCAGSAPAPRGRWIGSGRPVASRCPKAPTRCGSSRGTSRGTSALARGRAPSGSSSSALGRDRVVAKPGERFAILAVSQARTLRWQLGDRSGIARPGTLRLRAPDKAGTLRAQGRRQRAREAGARRRAGGAPMSVAAQAASVVGVRGARRALSRGHAHVAACRLVAWAAGLGVLGYTLLPDLSRDAARGRVGWRARPRRRRRRDPAALAVLPRVRDARVHPAAAPGRHREREGEPSAAALRRDRRARARRSPGR